MFFTLVFSQSSGVLRAVFEDGEAFANLEEGAELVCELLVSNDHLGTKRLKRLDSVFVPDTHLDPEAFDIAAQSVGN